MNPTDLVFIVQNELTKHPGKSSFVRLKHPRSQQICVYVWSKISGVNRLFEVQRISEKHRSWFLGNKIKSDGGAYFCTPVDPLFLILPAAREQNQFTTFHSLLDDNPELAVVLCEDTQWERKLLSICDSKVAGGQTVYRYNEELALSWLSDRVTAVSRVLVNLTDPDLIAQVRLYSNTSGSTGIDGDASSADARAPAFTTDSIQAQLLDSPTLSEDMCKKFAYQMVADYLTPDLADQLRDHLGLNSPTDGNRLSVFGKDESENVDPAPVRLNFSLQPTEDYSEALKKKEVTKPTEPVQKKAKHSKGMQSIASFFGKRST